MLLARERECLVGRCESRKGQAESRFALADLMHETERLNGLTSIHSNPPLHTAKPIPLPPPDLRPNNNSFLGTLSNPGQGFVDVLSSKFLRPKDHLGEGQKSESCAYCPTNLPGNPWY